MTRLIDADALIATLEDVGQHLKSPAFQLACIAAINEVKNAPTVDAVPVEWIKRWSKEPMTKKDMKLAEQCEGNILEWLIADWQRKEE